MTSQRRQLKSIRRSWSHFSQREDKENATPDPAPAWKNHEFTWTRVKSSRSRLLIYRGRQVTREASKLGKTLLNILRNQTVITEESYRESCSIPLGITCTSLEPKVRVFSEPHTLLFFNHLKMSPGTPLSNLTTNQGRKYLQSIRRRYDNSMASQKYQLSA